MDTYEITKRKLDRLTSTAICQAILWSSIDFDTITIEGLKKAKKDFMEDVAMAQASANFDHCNRSDYWRIQEKKKAAQAAIMSYLIAEMEADHDLDEFIEKKYEEAVHD